MEEKGPETDKTDRALHHIPRGTYRVQLNPEFTFNHASEIIDYLSCLGISDLYASPVFLARPESTHGYDICDFGQIDPRLGGFAQFENMASVLRQRKMGLLLDVVPNHMGISPCNQWWMDVLRRGPASTYASYFDIDWNPELRSLRGKVLLPVLGDRYGAVLDRGELKLAREKGEYTIAYFDKRFPLSAESVPALNSLSPQLIDDHNGSSRKTEAIQLLHQILEKQHYRLAFWRVGTEEINYRRFFDVSDMAAIRVEDPQVFQATHEFVLDLLKSGKVTGLRIDHPDGLRDPKSYFKRLQAAFAPGASEPALYVVAEKILSDEERLPEDWPVAGTTGYDFLIKLNGVFIKQGSADAFSKVYSAFAKSRQKIEWETVARASKREALTNLFTSELNALTTRLKSLAEQSWGGVDLTRGELRKAIVELIAAFPVYRTYADKTVTSGSTPLARADRHVLEEAVTKASTSRPRLVPALNFLASILRSEFSTYVPAETEAESSEFIARFQQLSGPATAKGLEDTAFYRFNRFISLNEVGGDPGQFGVSPAEFHAYNHYKQSVWPHSLLATATHDTKRGEDVRARLNVLSELPQEWAKAVIAWRDLNARHKTVENGIAAPSDSDEYFLYQTIIGSCPAEPNDAYAERLKHSMTKALREAKVNTSWLDPNERYESATIQFIESVLASKEFVASSGQLREKVAFFGCFNSLAQVVLKTCSPGVPDFYQGTELWDLSLVDPDNRRPVDYDLRKRLLSKTIEESKSDRPGHLSRLIADPQNSEIKLFTTWLALNVRKTHEELFTLGKYEPMRVTGSKAVHILTFARRWRSRLIIVAVPRLVCTLLEGKHQPPLGGIWDETRIDFQGGGRFENLFTGEELSAPLLAREMFARFPVALLRAL